MKKSERPLVHRAVRREAHAEQNFDEKVILTFLIIKFIFRGSGYSQFKLVLTFNFFMNLRNSLCCNCELAIDGLLFIFISISLEHNQRKQLGKFVFVDGNP